MHLVTQIILKTFYFILLNFHGQTHAYVLSSYWANDDNVRKALHIRKVYITLYIHTQQIFTHTLQSLLYPLIYMFLYK